MTMYNQVYDIYHGIYRIIHILNSLKENETIEFDRLRIWDFYILFPSKIREIRLSQDFKEAVLARRDLIAKINNPYNMVYDGRKLLERLRPYQVGSLNYLVSYGIIDSEELEYNKIKVRDRSKLLRIYEKIGPLSQQENNALNWLNDFFKSFPMNGKNGFKSRTNLLISKYDGC